MRTQKMSNSLPWKEYSRVEMVVGYMGLGRGPGHSMRDERTRIPITKAAAKKLIDNHVAIPSERDDGSLDIFIQVDLMRDFDDYAKARVRTIAEKNPHWNE